MAPFVSTGPVWQVLLRLALVKERLPPLFYGNCIQDGTKKGGLAEALVRAWLFQPANAGARPLKTTYHNRGLL